MNEQESSFHAPFAPLGIAGLTLSRIEDSEYFLLTTKHIIQGLDAEPAYLEQQFRIHRSELIAFSREIVQALER